MHSWVEEKTKKLLLEGETLFKWPDYMSYKDFNELIMFEEISEIDYKTILDNLY